MSVPKPPVALKNHCSVIYNNTLYTFQPNAFQSLDLKAGGKWSKLPMGLPTNGSVCIQGSPNGQDSMFIVGGTTNPSLPDYSGLQRYVFKTKKWEPIKLSSNVAQDRLGHGAAYLNDSSSIIIYAGYQNLIQVPSAPTFQISAITPYNISSYSSKAPALLKPLLMPWNASHALLLGGGQENKKFYTFGPGLDEWLPLDRQLSDGLKDSTKVQTAIFDADDGSKVLQIFDMSVSPNSISIRELRNATDKANPGVQSRTSTSSSPATETQHSRKRKRQTTSNRPTYNSTLASQTQRNGFSLAQDSTGLIVFSGGEPANNDEVLCIFDQNENQWIDPVQFFAADTKPDNPSSSPTSVTPTASSTAPASTTTSQSGSGGGSKNHSLTILGATLGAVFGCAAILIMILFLLRCLRRQRESTHKRKTSDYPADSKHEMDFADQGVNYMQEAGGSSSGRGSHKHTGSGQSINSMAIMAGTARAGSSQSKRGFMHRTGDSNGSTKSLFSRAKSPLAPSPPPISGPILNKPRDNNNTQASPEPRTEPRTDTGWSRYFTNNSSTNLATAGNTRQDSASRPTTYASGTQSDYASSRIASSNPRESAEVQPLSIRSGAPHPPNARIVSPTSGVPLQLQAGIAPSPRADGSNPPSPSTLVSEVNEDEYRHGDRSHESEGMASWTPIAASDRGSTWDDRPISSVYTESVIYPHPGERVRIPNFPRVPSTARNSTARNSTARNSQADPTVDPRGLRSMASRDLKTPPAGDQDRELPEVGSRRVMPPVYGNDREMRPYPRQPEEWDSRGRRPEPEDMSWLNLGRWPWWYWITAYNFEENPLLCLFPA